VRFLVRKKVLKLLLCSFLDDVLCPYRKTVRPCLMERCWGCRYFKQFNREMLEADEKVMDEIDEERRTGVSK
jgi:hypothetical protein